MLIDAHDALREQRVGIGARDAPRVLWQVIADLRKGTLKADVDNASVNALRLLLQLHETEQQDVRLGDREAKITRRASAGADARHVL